MSVTDQNTDANNTPSWEYEEEYHPPFLPALILFPPIAPLFWNYHIRVDESKMDLGYSHFFHHEIDRKLIQKAEVTSINGFTQWGGWGYRMNRDWHRGYITKNGPGVELTYKATEGGKDTVLVFNCNESEKICKILNAPVLNAVVH